MVPYVIRRSRRSRRVSVTLDSQNRALLTLPQRATLKAAHEFLGECGDWLIDQLAKIPKTRSLLEYLRDKPFLTLDGRRNSVSFAATNRCPFCEYKAEANQMILRYDPYAVNELRIQEALKNFSKPFIYRRLNTLCEYKCIDPPQRVTVRDQSSRWGSCSAAKGISLNWRLILLPIQLQDYVILHELAHLKEMNHSDSFWGLLLSYDRRSYQLDQKLDEVGKEIISLGQNAA